MGRHARRPAAVAAERGHTITAIDGAPLSINTIYGDRDGSLFVAALNGRLVPGGRQLVPVTFPAGLETLPIRNVFRDRQVSALDRHRGQGVVRVDGRPSSGYTMKDGLGNDFIRAFCEDADGGIWIGTDGGVSYWRVTACFRLHSDRTAWSIRAFAPCRSIGAAPLGRRTDGGVSRIRSASSSPTAMLDRLRGHRIWALHEDAAGGMWIGTQGAGLFLLKDGGLTQFTVAHGLPSNKIHFIGEDREGLSLDERSERVVSVSRADLETMRGTPSRHVAVRVYGTPEGLNTNQMTGGVQSAGVITSAGEVWLPSTKGAVRVAPNGPNAADTLSLPIEQVIADGRPVAVRADISCASGRWEAGDPLHVDSTRHA